MEQQLGSRAAIEHHRPPPLSHVGTADRSGSPPGYQPHQAQQQRSQGSREQQQQYSATGGGAAPGNHEDVESLEETIAHQKLEIVRLLNTVKTLSTENTKLVKVGML